MSSRIAQMEKPLSRALFEGEAYIEAQSQVGKSKALLIYLQCQPICADQTNSIFGH